MNTVLAVSALIVSFGLLIVNYTNQVERRHAEIIQLKEKIMSALSNLEQRCVAMLTNGELVRIELRRLPDSDDKYASIERLPWTSQINFLVEGRRW